MVTSEGRGFGVIAFILFAVLAMVSCVESSTNGVRMEKSFGQPAQAELNGESTVSEGNGDIAAVRPVEMPTRAGLRLAYHSDILAFNLVGDAILAPIFPRQVWEYRIGDSSRAVAVVDERTGSAIVILYDGSGPEKQAVLLDCEDAVAKGWLLRGQSGEQVKQEEVRQLLSAAAKSSRAFELKGKAVIDIKDGYVQSISLADVATKSDVPVDAERLRRQIEFLEHQRDQLMQKAKEKPDNELLSWGVRQAEEQLRRRKHMAETEPSAPAQLTNGRIVAQWERQKPLINLILP